MLLFQTGNRFIEIRKNDKTMKKILATMLFLLVAVAFPLVAQNNATYQLSTHILDINRGVPASGVTIELYSQQKGEWVKIDEGRTDSNGRIGNFLPYTEANDGIYKLKFLVAPYFEVQQLSSIYPYVEVVFRVTGNGHYHIPLTLSANGYSTYRGS